LAGDREVGLDEEGVGAEAEQGAEVGERVEAVRRGAGVEAGVPALEQRASGGEGEEGQADGGEQEGDDRGDRGVAGLGAPGVAGDDRGGPAGDAGEEEEEAEEEQGEVDGALARRWPPGEGVGVGVAAEQGELKKEHAGGPDGRGAAEPREQALAEDELDLEEQEGAEADRGGEEGEVGALFHG
jgi:hypothetical protein